MLDTRLLCIIPRNWGRKSFSIQYADIRTVAIEDNQSYLRLIVEPAYKADVDELDILIKARHKDYTVKFAEVLRTRVRDAQMPSRKVEIYEKSSTLFIDELERLAALHKQGNLSDEEFAAAKKKLLS